MGGGGARTHTDTIQNSRNDLTKASLSPAQRIFFSLQQQQHKLQLCNSFGSVPKLDIWHIKCRGVSLHHTISHYTHTAASVPLSPSIHHHYLLRQRRTHKQEIDCGRIKEEAQQAFRVISTRSFFDYFS